MKYLLPVIIIFSIFIPTINIAGIPFRIEDGLILLIFIYLLSSKTFQTKNEFTTIVRFFCLFICISFLSLVVSMLEGYNASLQDFNNIFLYVKSCFVLFVSYNLGYYLQKVTLNYILISFSLGLFLSACLAMVQYFNLFGFGESAYLLYGKESRIEYGVNRAIGAFRNPNYASYFHSIGFVLALNIKSSNIKVQFLKYTFLIIFFCSIIVSFSRTGIVGLVIAWFFSLVLQKGYKHIFSLVASIFIAGVYYLDKLIEGTRFYTILTQEESFGLSNFGNRTNLIWSKRFENFLNNPIIGTGPGKNRFNETIFGVTIYDNSFLLLLITTGTIGTLLYLLFYFNLLKTYIKPIANSDFKFRLRSSYLPIASLTIVFFFTSDLIWNMYFVTYFYLLSGVYLSLFYQNQIKPIK